MAELVTASGDVDNSALGNISLLDSADVISIANNTSAATAVFDTLDSLPTTGLSAGQQAFVNENNRLYISNGTGWYNLTFVNRTPTWAVEPDAEYEIADSQTPLIVTARATDSDNSIAQLVNQSVVSDSAQYMVNISNDSSVWTFTPKSADSIGIEVAAGNLTDSNGDFEYTFKWSDGINFVSKVSTITYNTASGGNNSAVGIRGFNQGVFGTWQNSTASMTLSVPVGTQVGDKALVCIGGMGWNAPAANTSVSFPNNDFTLKTEYQWGYAAGQYAYRTNLYECTLVTQDMVSNGVTVNCDYPSPGGTDYKMVGLFVFGGAVDQLYNHAQINYTGSYTQGNYYSAASAAPPTGYLTKSNMIEIHNTRAGQRTYVSTGNSVLQGAGVSRGGTTTYYRQLVYYASNPHSQLYHRWQAGDAYSSSSLVISF